VTRNRVTGTPIFLHGVDSEKSCSLVEIYIAEYYAKGDWANEERLLYILDKYSESVSDQGVFLEVL
jgi:hypothetical protein